MLQLWGNLCDYDGGHKKSINEIKFYTTRYKHTDKIRQVNLAKSDYNQWINVHFIVILVILYYSYAKCCNWEKLPEWYTVLYIISHDFMYI